MAGFTLIQGSTQNATAWSAVAALLCERGHSVATPDLPKNEPQWTLRTYADFIGERMDEARPRVLVAHSFCGVFLPLLAGQADLLVFEGGLIPEPGRSVREQFVADASMFSPAWIASGSRWFDPATYAALAREFLFHDCDEATMAPALTTLEVFDTRALVTEPSPLAEWPSIRCASIVCTNDRTITPDWSRRAAARVGAEVIEIDSGHSPHTSRPAAIAAILERLAVG
jgi:pimeloyl-ACP methyl ester carboxylesterase